MEDISKRLQTLVDTHAGGKHTVFAKAAGIIPTTFQNYISGRTPSAESLVNICEHFGVNLNWLLTGKGPQYLRDLEKGGQLKRAIQVEETLDSYDRERFNEVGVYALAGAGPARELVEHEPIEMIVVPKSFWKPSIVAIKVRGRSMEPLILDGAYIGIDREDKWVISGEIYAVWIPYEGAVIKRLYIDPEKITLRSDNKDFPEFSIPVKEANAEMILGRVKWVLQQF
jgi:phage repressor protein C with HTH and peptisase S24 domain